MEHRRTLSTRLRTLPLFFALTGTFILFGRQSFAGTTVIHELKSAFVAVNSMGISAERRIAVYVPDGYQESKRRYPVIYWLPGWQQPATNEYERGLNRAIQIGRLPAVIVVSIHVPEGVLLVNSQLFGLWESFLIDEVIPFVDKTYRTIPKASHRALMGHSVGGYAALMLPLLHPGIWSAIGVNDGSVWLACDFRESKHVPFSISQYSDSTAIAQVIIQLGVSLTPNPQKPLGFDSPWESDSNAAIVARWDSYCLKNPQTLDFYRDKLLSFSSIAIVVPEEPTQTNRDHEIRLIEQMWAQNLPVTVLSKSGGHDGDRSDRFISLAAEVLRGMTLEVPRAFTWVGKLSVSWGEIRRTSL